MANYKPCETCKGRGYYESPHLYYGRAECGMCQGFGCSLDTICTGCGETLEKHLDDYDQGKYNGCDFQVD